MSERSSLPLSWPARIALILAGGGALTLLLLASTLDPDPRGLGTHLQLGLAPCTVRTLFGIRCPACGMTTSWALATQGRLGAALATNSAGVVLAAIALVGGAASIVFAIRGAWPSRLSAPTMLAAMLTLIAIVVTDWMIRLAGS